MSYALRGRKVLVTGGARGIGAEIVRKFAAEGCDIALNYLSSEDRANELAGQMREQYSVRTAVIQGDMAKVSDCTELVKKTIDLFRGLNIIVSNAGNTKIATFDDLFALEEGDWDHAWNVLTKSNVFLLRATYETFQSNPDGGVFLIMNSLAGLITNGSSMAYSVTRAAALHLMQCLAQSQGPKIRVNAACPGLVDTERTQVFSAGRREGFREMAALKRITTTEDVAGAFVFLAKNPATTGERIRIDSGMAVC